ncbi:unnamed protein product [Lathyrus oleraceus]
MSTTNNWKCRSSFLTSSGQRVTWLKSLIDQELYFCFKRLREHIYAFLDFMPRSLALNAEEHIVPSFPHEILIGYLIVLRKGVSQLAMYGHVLIYYIVIPKSKRFQTMISYPLGVPK